MAAGKHRFPPTAPKQAWETTSNRSQTAPQDFSEIHQRLDDTVRIDEAHLTDFANGSLRQNLECTGIQKAAEYPVSGAQELSSQTSGRQHDVEGGFHLTGEVITDMIDPKAAADLEKRYGAAGEMFDFNSTYLWTGMAWTHPFHWICPFRSVAISRKRTLGCILKLTT